MSSRGSKKAKTHRMDGVIAALIPLGFSQKLIRHTVKELIKAYGDNEAGWYFVEENYYKMVIDKMIEEQDGEKEELDVVNEENEATALIEACGGDLPELEGGSSSHRDLPRKLESSHESAPIKLEECSDTAAGGGHPSSSVPKRRPCYGWISEEED